MILKYNITPEYMKCQKCEEHLELKNIKYDTYPAGIDISSIMYNCDCGYQFFNDRIKDVMLKFLETKNDKEKIKDFIINDLGEQWIDHKKIEEII
jgi:predicted transcriptional regulator